jgi:hypothetical protein
MSTHSTATSCLAPSPALKGGIPSVHPISARESRVNAPLVAVHESSSGASAKWRAAAVRPDRHCHKPMLLIAVGSVLDLFFLQ